MTAEQAALLIERVSEIAARVLGITSLAVDADLFAIDGFNSIAIAELIERLERELDLELDPALILPETFATPTALAKAAALSIQASVGGAR